VPEIIAVMLDAASGLVAAHEAGIIHRDFKPDNVMVPMSGGLKIVDFGLARPYGEDIPSLKEGSQILTPAVRTREVLQHAKSRPQVTTTGALVGTPAYMAPDVLDGAEASPASDQYAFAITLHEALFGERPYRGMSIDPPTTPEGFADLRPTHASIAALRFIPSLARMLAPDPRRRFASVREARDALLREERRAERRRRTLGWSALAILVFAVIGGLLVIPTRRAISCENRVAGLQQEWTARQRSLAAQGRHLRGPSHAVWDRAVAALSEYAARLHSTRSNLCEGLGESAFTEVELVRRQSCLDRRGAILSDVTDAFVALSPEALLKAATSSLALPSPEGCLGRAGMIEEAQNPESQRLRSKVERGRAMILTRDTQGAIAKLESLDDQIEQTRTPHLHAEYLTTLGHAYYARGLHGRIVSANTRAFEAARQLERSDLAFETSLRIAAFMGEQREPARARDWMLHAWVSANEDGSDDFKVRALITEGILDVREGIAAPAHEKLNEAITTQRAVTGGSDDLTVAEAMRQKGYAYKEQGLLLEATQAHQQALTIFERILGPEHPLIARSLEQIGSLLAERGLPERGVTFIERSVPLLTTMYGPNSTRLIPALGNLGLTYNELDRPGDALARFEEILRILDHKFGATPSPKERAGYLRVYIALTQAKIGLGRLEEARRTIQRAVETEREIGEVQLAPSIHGDIWTTKAMVEEADGDRTQAIADTQRALDTHRQRLGEDHLYTAISRAKLAALRIDAGESPLDPTIQRLLRRAAVLVDNESFPASLRGQLQHNLQAAGLPSRSPPAGEAGVPDSVAP
jgi:eukaryotic-like serine/threonine-protein kinase